MDLEREEEERKMRNAWPLGVTVLAVVFAVVTAFFVAKATEGGVLVAHTLFFPAFVVVFGGISLAVWLAERKEKGK